MKLKKWNMLPLILGLFFLGSSCEKKDADINLTAMDWKVEKIRQSCNMIIEASTGGLSTLTAE